MQNLSGSHLIVILFIILLLFGAPKLPALAKSLGQSMRILKKEVSSETGVTRDSAEQAGSSATTPQPAANGESSAANGESSAGNKATETI
jgi:sec-independent protein translocase protein TatA